MARVVLGSYAVQFPVGGYLSWVLAVAVGLQDLGHEPWFIERSLGPPRASTPPPAGWVMTDPSTAAMRTLLARHAPERTLVLHRRLGRVPRATLATWSKPILSRTDLFIDMGTHGLSIENRALQPRGCFVDGEPGSTQFRLAERLAGGAVPPEP